jgi:hypothetical protein
MVVVLVQGGVVQRVFADDDVEVVIVDYDCSDKSIDGSQESPGKDAEGTPVKIYVACTSPVSEVPSIILLPS